MTTQIILTVDVDQTRPGMPLRDFVLSAAARAETLQLHGDRINYYLSLSQQSEVPLWSSQLEFVDQTSVELVVSLPLGEMDQYPSYVRLDNQVGDVPSDIGLPESYYTRQSDPLDPESPLEPRPWDDWIYKDLATPSTDGWTWAPVDVVPYTQVLGSVQVALGGRTAAGQADMISLYDRQQLTPVEDPVIAGEMRQLLFFVDIDDADERAIPASLGLPDYIDKDGGGQRKWKDWIYPGTEITTPSGQTLDIRPVLLPVGAPVDVEAWRTAFATAVGVTFLDRIQNALYLNRANLRDIIAQLRQG